VRYFRKTLRSPLKLAMFFPSDGKAVRAFENIPSYASELDSFRERDRFAVGAPRAEERSALMLQEKWELRLEYTLQWDRR
jgi:hypothetical protein